MQPIYLDYNATTPIAREVTETMTPFLFEHFGNPSSSHPYGAIAKVYDGILAAGFGSPVWSEAVDAVMYP